MKKLNTPSTKISKLATVLLFTSIIASIQYAKGQCTWMPMGPDDKNQASNNHSLFTSIAISPLNIPYVLYTDGSFLKPSVKKFENNRWANVGADLFTSNNVYYPELAIDNNSIPYIVYSDASVSPSKASVMKFNGTSWVFVGTQAFSAGTAEYNDIAINGTNTPYVAYSDLASSSKATVKKFDGTNWITVGTQGFSTNAVSYTSIAIDANGTPYIAYKDVSTTKINVKKFDGSSWISVGADNFSAGRADYTTITISADGTPYVAYQDYANGQKANVMKFDGSTWVYVGTITTGISSSAAYFPSIKCNNANQPIIVYQDFANSKKATAKKFDGTNWVTVGSIGFSDDIASYTGIALNSDGTPFVVFMCYAHYDKTEVMKYNGTQWEKVGDWPLTIGTAPFLDIAIDKNSYPYLVYSDAGDNNKAIVKKFNGSTWATVGTTGFSTNSVQYTSIAINSLDIPYVLHKDLSTGKATVKKFDGSNWVTVGSSSFSAGTVTWTDIAIDPMDVPYVVYADNNKATVKKFDGSSWVNVGSAGFSAGNIAFSQIAIDANGTPYVVYMDYSTSPVNAAIVKKFDVAASAWVDVGTNPISAGQATYTSIAINSLGTLYIAYSDNSQGDKATVKKFDGTSWVNVGSAGFSAGQAYYINLAIGANDIPYITYRSQANLSKCEVRKFDGTAWVVVDAIGISASICQNNKLAVDQNGQIVVGYDNGGVWERNYLPVLPTTFKSITENQSGSHLYMDNCEVIAKVNTTSASGQAGGNTTAKVWIDNNQNYQFVKRHYEISPTTNGEALVTLYFTKDEFESFNAVSPIKLPMNSGDVANKANILIEKREGSSSDGSGHFATYGAATNINPDDDNIKWNEVFGRWEITFHVTSFSGFWLKVQQAVIPVQWMEAYGSINIENKAIIKWKVVEQNISKYLVEKSSDAINYSKIFEINSKGDGQNSYMVEEQSAINKTQFYRIKMVDKDGKFNYSQTIKLIPTQNVSATVFPNPFSTTINVHVTKELIGTTATLVNITGNNIKQLKINKSDNSFILDYLKPGIYILKLSNGQALKLVKE